MPDADIWNLSPGEASARLQSIKLAATPPATDLAARSADEKWRTNVLSGNGPETKELHTLVEAKLAGDTRLEQVLTGTAGDVPIFETTTGDQLSTWKLGRIVADPRDDGLADDHIRELFAGEPIAKELHDAALRLQQQRFGDAEYVRRYLAGGAVEIREQRLIGIIIGRPIAEGEAAPRPPWRGLRRATGKPRDGA
jgi:hypothetical protein